MVYSKRRFCGNNHTRKLRPRIATICGKIRRANHQGWKIIEVYGSPFDRGFAHGYLLYRDLSKLLRAFPSIFDETYDASDYPLFQRICKDQIAVYVQREYPEYYTELRGMVAGAKHRGVPLSLAFLIEWNSFLSVDGILPSSKQKLPRHERCSAFIATGTSTADGDIVMAHNTHDFFSQAPFSKIVQYMTPEKGHTFCMQTMPGLLCSSTDWFLTSAGLVGCESTIGDMDIRPDFTHAPYFCRIRDCMQYATSLDQCIHFMGHCNAGDYPCTWLLGDTRSGEIMLLEVGAGDEMYVDRTKNGVFYTANSATGLRHASNRNRDMSTSSGARSARLHELLTKTHKGNIDATVAKRILADHYDMWLEKEHKGYRTICRHADSEEDIPANAIGTIDGKVVTTEMAKQMRFWGRYGSSCGSGHGNDAKTHDISVPKVGAWVMVR
jgi:hypothetical protein